MTRLPGRLRQGSLSHVASWCRGSCASSFTRGWRWGSACGRAAEQAPLYRSPPATGRRQGSGVSPITGRCRAELARLRYVANHRVLRGAGWGCPLVVSKGGGGGRRPTPGDMETKGHPRPAPRRCISVAILGDRRPENPLLLESPISSHCSVRMCAVSKFETKQGVVDKA